MIDVYEKIQKVKALRESIRRRFIVVITKYIGHSNAGRYYFDKSYEEDIDEIIKLFNDQKKEP
jgi:predicted CopG family antitoxin